MLIGCIAIAVFAVVFIFFSRGYINYANRMDFIGQRLEAYPRMRDNHLSELEQMKALLLTSDYNSLARQAVFLYDRTDTQSDEAEKIRHITETLGVTKVSIIPVAGQQSGGDAATAEEANRSLIDLILHDIIRSQIKRDRIFPLCIWRSCLKTRKRRWNE